MERELLFDWYQIWVSALLDLPSLREAEHLRAWQRLGQWLGAPSGVLNRIVISLKDTPSDVHPVTKLRAGFRIGIFTLRPQSAKAAANILEKYNSELKIQVCAEKDINSTVETIASHADMVVIVATCLTHALFYGIEPLVEEKNIIYPVSAGTTSILRAITSGVLNYL